MERNYRLYQDPQRESEETFLMFRITFNRQTHRVSLNH